MLKCKSKGSYYWAYVKVAISLCQSHLMKMLLDGLWDGHYLKVIL